MACGSLASFPGPKRRRKGLVSAVRACANRGGIPPPPHTIDILSYAPDARIDTNAAINVMPHPPQVGVGGELVGGLIQNLGPRGRGFDPE